jgi:hypothetical protein
MGFGLFLLNSVCLLMDLFCEQPARAEPEAKPVVDLDAPRGGRALLQGADGWAGGRIGGKLSLSTSEELP